MRKIKKKKQHRKKSLGCRMLFTITSLVIIRILYTVPTPGIDMDFFKTAVQQEQALGFFSMMAGNNMSNLSIMVLGVSTYVTATILTQLLCAFSDRMDALQKGSKKERRFMDLLTLGLAVIASLTQGILLIKTYGARGLLKEYTTFCVLLVLAVWTIAAIALSVYGKWMTQRKDLFIGNGISQILVLNVVFSMPKDFLNVWQRLSDYCDKRAEKILMAGAVAVFIFFLVTGLILLKRCEARIPLVYTVSEQKDISTSLNYIPLKLCSSSVVPVIFTSTFFTIPVLLREKFAVLDTKWIDIFDTQQWFQSDKMWASLGIVLYVISICFFSFVYQELTKPSEEIAAGLRSSGAVIPGITPGTETSKYLNRKRNCYMLLGSVFLSFLAIFPIALTNQLEMNQNISFLGTTIIIVVDVLLDTKDAIYGALKVKGEIL